MIFPGFPCPGLPFGWSLTNMPQLDDKLYGHLQSLGRLLLSGQHIPHCWDRPLLSNLSFQL